MAVDSVGTALDDLVERCLGRGSAFLRLSSCRGREECRRFISGLARGSSALNVPWSMRRAPPAGMAEAGAQRNGLGAGAGGTSSRGPSADVTDCFRVE